MATAFAAGLAAAATDVARRRARGWSVSVLAMVGVGYIAVAVLMRDVGGSSTTVVGRPVRRRGRAQTAVLNAHRGRHVGDLWLEAAREEAASVIAFDEMADLLVDARAAASPVERCRGAARDEVRHSRQCQRIGRSLGASRPFIEPDLRFRRPRRYMPRSTVIVKLGSTRSLTASWARASRRGASPRVR